MNNSENNTTWVLDPSHSVIEFKIKHLMISNVKGAFKKFSGSVTTKGLDFMTAEVSITIDPSSIDTGDKKRDEHLKSNEFFESEKFDEITFVSHNFIDLNNGMHYEMNGELTIKGVSKKVKLKVEFGGIIKDPWGNEKAGFNVTGTVNRKDWGLNWNASLDTGGVMLSDDVKIDCDVEFVRHNNEANKTEASRDKETAQNKN